jgi:restriction system protein
LSTRRKKSGIDELFDLLEMAPAWLGPVLAVVGFVVIRYIAPAVLGSIGGEIPIGETLALLIPRFAWLFVAVVLVVWIAAEVKKLLNRRMLDRQTGPETQAALSWSQFEELVAEAYRRRGYTAEVTGRPSGDGGIDIVLHGRGEKALVQCKHWKVRQVGVARVRELAGVVAAEKADRGILVTSGRFTRDAEKFAEKSPIEMIDGPALAAMIAGVRRAARPPQPNESRRPEGAPSASSGPTGEAHGAGKLPARPATSPAHARIEHPEEAATTPRPVPQCPTCNTEMVVRIARRGEHAGSNFWGCPRFPACRGTRQMG